MKTTYITLFAGVLLFSSCGSMNYGRIKYQSVDKVNSSTVVQESDESILAFNVVTIIENETYAIAEVGKISTIEEGLLAPPEPTTEVKVEKEKSTKTLFSQSSLEILQKIELIEDKLDEEDREKNKAAYYAGIFGGLSFIPLVGWVFSILAIVNGSIAIKQYRDSPDKYIGTDRRARIGMVFGIITIIIGVTLVLLTFLAMSLCDRTEIYGQTCDQ